MNWFARGQDVTGLKRLQAQVGEVPTDHADAPGVALKTRVTFATTEDGKQIAIGQHNR